MAVELREHPRFTTYLSAELILPDGHRYPCQVLDYSQTGIHLLWPHGVPAATENLMLELALDKPVKVPVDWVFSNDQHAGLQFRSPDCNSARPTANCFCNCRSIIRPAATNAVSVLNKKRSTPRC